MFYQVVAIARDWALILLALEGMILLAVPLFLLWQITKRVRGFLPQVRSGLRTVHATVIRITAVAEDVMAKIRAPFLWIETNYARLLGFRRAWRRDRGVGGKV